MIDLSKSKTLKNKLVSINVKAIKKLERKLLIAYNLKDIL